MTLDRRAILLSIVVGLAACASPEAEPRPKDESPIGATSQELETNTCSAGSSASDELQEWASSSDPNRVCAGPWRYSTHRMCPTTTCKTYQAKTCFSWGFPSSSTTPLSFIKTFVTPEKCHIIPVCEDGQCWDTQVCQPDGLAGEKKCTQLKNASVSSIQATVGSVNAHFVTTSSHEYVLGETSTCKYTINKPVMAQGTDADLCGKDCVEYQLGECDDRDDRWSAPGLARSSLLGPGEVLDNATCSTRPDLGGETLAKSRYSQLQSERTKLASAVAAGAAPSTYYDWIDKTKVLVFELYGHTLTGASGAPDEAQLADARALYAVAKLVPSCGPERPGAYHCAAHAPTPPATLPSGASASLDANEIVRCTRLLSSHVQAPLVSAELARCVGALAFATDTEWCTFDGSGKNVRDFTRETLAQVWTKQLPLLADSASYAGALGLQLHLLDRWYDGNAFARRRTQAEVFDVVHDSPEVAKDMSIAFRSFYERLHTRFNVVDAGALAALDQAAPTAEQLVALEAAATSGREQGTAATQAVLTAAFTPVTVSGYGGATTTKTPLGGMPLLSLVADGLVPFAGRLDDMTVFHDFGCSLTDCKTLWGVGQSPLAGYYAVLAGMDDSAAFKAALDSLPDDSNSAKWKPVFSKIHDNRSALDSARWQAIHIAIDGGTVSADLDTLYRLKKDASERSKRYQSTQLFLPSAKTLDSGLDSESRDAIKNAISSKQQNLETLRGEYKNALVTLLRERLARNSTKQNEARVRFLLKKNALEYDRLEANMSGLAASLQADESHFGDMVEGLRKIESGLNQSHFLEVVNGGGLPISLTGASATYTGDGGDGNPASLALRSFDVEPGEMLSVESAGSWAPTCALRTVGTLGPQGETLSIDASATTGPEGYQITQSGSQYSASSAGHTVSNSNSTYWNASVCVFAEASGSFPLATVPSPFSAKVGVKAEACAGYRASHDYTESRNGTNGSDFKTSSTYVSGMRLPNTPFATMPVGSLLAFVVRRNTGTILDVQVVHQPSSAILVPEAATVHLVVNDRKCDSPNATSTLTVNARRLKSAGAVAPAVVAAMKESLAALRANLPTYVAQGRLLPSQVTLMRSTAATTLDNKLLGSGVSAATLPAPLTNLWNAYLDYEIVRVERAIEQEAIRQQLATLDLERESYEAELASTGEAGRLHALLVGHALADTDGDVLRAEAIDLLVKTRDYFVPVLDLWYPAAWSTLQATPGFKTAVLQLTKSSLPSTDLLSLVTATGKIVTAMTNTFNGAVFGNDIATGRTLVAVSFPKPGTIVSGPFGDATTIYRQADATRSAAFWRAVLRSGRNGEWSPAPAPLTVLPSDLYSNGSGIRSLPCTEVMPVVTRMKLFFAKYSGFGAEASNLNGQGRTIDILSPMKQTFLTDVGEREYSFAPNTVYRTSTASAIYGDDSEAATAFNSSSSWIRPVGGISPFGTHEVRVDTIAAPSNGWNGAKTYFEEVDEMVLLMELDSKEGGRVKGVPVCAGP